MRTQTASCVLGNIIVKPSVSQWKAKLSSALDSTLALDVTKSRQRRPSLGAADAFVVDRNPTLHPDQIRKGALLGSSHFAVCDLVTGLVPSKAKSGVFWIQPSLLAFCGTAWAWHSSSYAPLK
jgi:hypothetical protein